MVFVNEKKFACESCIKGHRSSSCAHADRPLFEVKKKGRPVSQCEQCRELRKTRQVHSKCICATKDTKKPAVRRLTANSKRSIPVQPTLPNGLKDVYPELDAEDGSSGMKMDALLNPCTCKDVWSCKCRSSGQSTADICSMPSNGGLAALAQAAALFSSRDISSSSDLTAKHHSGAPAPPQKSCCSGKVKIIPNPSTDQESKSSKRKQRGSPSPTPPPSKQANHGPRTHSQSLPPIKLPPIFTPTTSLSSTTHINPLPSSASPFPSFPTIPPLSSIAAIAGSGCCCGFRCTCPGCVEHRGAEYASRDHEDCPDGCGTCVDWDNEAGVELPKAHSYHSTDVHTVLSSDTAGSSSSAISNLDVYGEKRLAAGSSKSILSTSSTSTNFIDAYFSQARTPISPSVASGSPRATEKQKEDEPAPQKSSTNEKNKKSSCCCGDADEGDDEDIEAKGDLDDAKTMVKAHE